MLWAQIFWGNREKMPRMRKANCKNESRLKIFEILLEKIGLGNKEKFSLCLRKVIGPYPR